MICVKPISAIAILGVVISACSQTKVVEATTETTAKTIAKFTPNAPNLQTPPPIILLKDNLDEKDRLGWCIDTKGRGFTEQLHAHSCKPAGDDVLFSYNAVSGQIRSATYANKCAQIVGEDPLVPFGLLDCDEDNPAQRFNYNAETSELQPRGQEGQCIVAGENSRAAGPFMSRDLLLTACKDASPSLKQWTVLTSG